MTTNFPHYGPEQREMVERWLGRLRKRLAGARDTSDVGRALACERHLDTLNQPLPMSAQRFVKLEAEVADVQGEGAFLLVVDCGETGINATCFARRFATVEELQEAKRQVDAQRCGPGCGRNHLLYRLVLSEDGSSERRSGWRRRSWGTPRRHPDHDHPSEEDHGWNHSARVTH